MSGIEPLSRRWHFSAFNPIGAGLFAILLLCALAYWAGMFGGFLFDDFNTIVNNAALRSLGTANSHWLAAALSTNTGTLRRPVSMLSFGLNVVAFGMSPFAFKLVNLGIHLANGGLLYAIALRIAPRLLRVGDTSRARAIAQTAALFAAGIWLLHPLHVSTVVYVVQRMNLLATLFMLAGLLCYVDGRERALRGEPALASGIAGLCLFGLLAVFSKENGALVFAYALVIEAICYRFETQQPNQRRGVAGFFIVTVALPLLASLMFLATHPGWLPGAYSSRTFTLGQRLLTEGRVLCDYLLWTVLPNPNWMGLFHDDIAVSTGLFSPPSTILALALLAATAVAAWRLRERSPGFTFAVAWFLIGHSMESSILPLEIVFEHRNYLPMTGLLVGMVCAVAGWVKEFRQSLRIGAVVGMAAIGICASLTAVRAKNWSDPLRLALAEVGHHPKSSRCQYEAGRAIVIDGAEHGRREAADAEALPYFDRAAALDPTDLNGVVQSLLIRARASDKPIDPASVSELRSRLAAAATYNLANPFLDLLTAASTEKLSLTEGDIATLVDAAMSNGHFPPKIRAMVLNNYGAYRFNVAHDSNVAINLTTAAAAEDPTNPYFQLNLAKIALAMQRKDVARERLQSAKSLDAAGWYDRDIEMLERQLVQ